MASKAYLAKRLIELGCPLKFNTLRKRSARDLAVMLLDRETATRVESARANAMSAPPIAKTEVVPASPSVPVAHRAGSRMAWLALAMLPVKLLRTFVGTGPLCLLGL
jgi:hypothetical protein